MNDAAPQSGSKKTAIWVLVAILVVLVGVGSFALSYRIFGNKADGEILLVDLTADKNTLIEQTIASVKSMVKLPMEVDAATTWTHITADLDNGFVVYRYTVKELTAEQVQMMQKLIYKQVVKTMCPLPDAKAVLAAGAGYKWTYFSETDEPLMEFTLTEGGCDEEKSNE